MNINCSCARRLKLARSQSRLQLTAEGIPCLTWLSSRCASVREYGLCARSFCTCCMWYVRHCPQCPCYFLPIALRPAPCPAHASCARAYARRTHNTHAAAHALHTATAHAAAHAQSSPHDCRLPGGDGRREPLVAPLLPGPSHASPRERVHGAVGTRPARR